MDAADERGIGSRIRARFFPSCVPALVLLLANDAHADSRAPRTSSLSWIRLKGAEECVSTQDLARDVEERLGRPVFVSAALADVSVEGHVERTSVETGWVVSLTIRDAIGVTLGTRELKSAERSCTAIREPTALVIAVMIDPDAALHPKPVPSQGPAPLKAEPPAAPEPAVVHAEPAPIETPAAVWRNDFGASIIGGLGVLPRPAFGIHASAIVEPPRFVPLEGFGAVWFDNTADSNGPGRASFALMFLGGGMCPARYHSARFHAYLCSAWQLGLLSSRGTGFDVPRPDERTVWLAGALDGRMTFAVAGPFSVRIGASGILPLIRHSFVVRNANGTQSTLFQPSIISGTFDIGGGMVFP